MGFFFKCIYEINDSYKLYTQAIHIFKEIFLSDTSNEQVEVDTETNQPKQNI